MTADNVVTTHCVCAYREKGMWNQGRNFISSPRTLLKTERKTFKNLRTF